MDDCDDLEITTYGNTSITVTLPAHEVGNVTLKMLLGSLGYADVRYVQCVCTGAFPLTDCEYDCPKY